MLTLRIKARHDLSPKQAKYFLLLITLFGAILRFTRLGFPTARTDEAFTYWRTCGSFNQLFDTLRLDAFVPLHYELVWLLSKIFGYGLWAYRLPGAVAGLLMPIAIYLLARTIFNRRVGVISAMIAMSSTYFCFYARDAKMYMPAWFLTTLASAFAFRFITTGRRINWLTYVFFGTAAAGVHALTLLPLAIVPLASVAIRGHQKIKRVSLVLLGFITITIGPLIYYQTFNRWFTVSGGLSGVPQGTTTEEPPHDNGLMWVKTFQNGYGTEGVLNQSLGAYLFGYEYPPVEPNNDPNTWGDYQAYHLCRIAFWILFLAAMIVGTISIILKRKIDRGRFFWLGAVMIALPLYGFYLRSFTSFTAPWMLMKPIVLIPALLMLVLICLRSRKRAVIWLVSSIALLIVAWAGAKMAYAHAPRLPDGTVVWNHLWMPRYAAFVVPMIFVMVAGLLDRLPTRVVRWSVIGGFISLNLTGSIATMTCLTGWPDDQIARDAASTIGNENIIVGGNILRPGRLPLYPVITRCYNLAVESNWPMDPPSFRKGNQWPYIVGYQVEPMMSSMRLVSLYPVARALNIPLKIDHIILWTKYDPKNPIEWKMDGWHLMRKDDYTVRVAWSWAVSAYLRREEYIRQPK